MTTPYPLPRAIRTSDEAVSDGVSVVLGPFGFRIFDTADVTLEIRASASAKWQPVSCTVRKLSGADYDHFTVELGEPLPAGMRWRVRGTRLHERSAGISRGSRLDMRALEKELSKLGTVAQEHYRDIYDIVQALGGLSTPGIPSPGGGGTGGRAAHVDSRDFAFAANGSDDDTATFQAMAAEAHTAGLPAYLHHGKYLLDNALLTEQVAIYGMGASGNELQGHDTGTWIYHVGTANPAIRLEGPNVRGSILAGLNFHSPQPAVTQPDVIGSWAPTQRPHTVSVKNTYGGVELRRLFFDEVYAGISAVNAGRTQIAEIDGQFFQNIIYLDQQYDACAISNIHAWPWTKRGGAVYSWQHLYHVSFLLGRVDSAVFSGEIFSYAGRYLFQIAGTAAGIASRIKIHSAQADAIPCGLFISEGADKVMVDFGHLDIQGQNVAIWRDGQGTLGAVEGLPAIYIDAANARVNIASLRTELHHMGLVTFTPRAKGGRISVGSVHGISYNLSNAGAAFDLGSTNPATNGGFPVNRVSIGTDLFLEGPNPDPQLMPGSTGVLTLPAGGSSAAGDRLATTGGYVVRVDAPSGLHGQVLVRSALGANQVVQFIAEGTGANVDIQLLPKGAGRIIDAAGNPLGTGGGGSGGTPAKLVSPDTTQEAEIKNAGGLFVTDETQAMACNLTANGNIGGTPGKSVWELTIGGVTTYDLKSYIDGAAGGGAGGSSLTSGTATASLSNAGVLTVSFSGISAAYQNDGNITGARAFNNSTNGGLGGNGTLTNYIDVRADAVFSSKIGSATAGRANSLGPGHGGVQIFQSLNGSMFIGAAAYQNDGMVLGTAYQSSQNGGLGGTGSLSSYIEARAAAFSDLRLKKKASIRRFRHGLSVVRQVQPQSFEYLQAAGLPTGRHNYFIAQDFEAVAPDLLALHPQNDRYVLDTKGLIATLWNAVSELATDVEKLKEAMNAAGQR